MSAITVTAAQVAAVWPEKSEIYSFQAAETITAGQAVYITSAGKAGVADANGSGTTQYRGIALTGGGAGQAIDVLVHGAVYGFDLSGLNYDAATYLSDTVGALDTASGSLAVNTGRVMALNDTGNLTKVLYVQADWLRTWA
jgi:hypothetical protein